MLSEAIEGADALGDRGLKGHAAVVRLMLMGSTDPKGLSEVALRELEATIPVFEELGDDRGLARTWRLKADVDWTRARYAAADEAIERAIDHARRAKAVWEEADSLGLYTGTAGLRSDARRRGGRAVRTDPGRGRAATGWCRTAPCGRSRPCARCRADSTRRASWRRARATPCRTSACGSGRRSLSETLGFVERLAGDAAAAERALRAGYDIADKLGERGYLSTAATLLAHAVLDQGRLDDADSVHRRWARRQAPRTTSPPRCWCGAPAAGSLAARGRPQEAEPHVREAVALAEETDDLNMRADVLMDLAEVVGLGGDRAEMTRVLDRAIALYEAKGNIVMAAEARRRQSSEA